MNNEIEQIKHSIPILDLARSYGFELKKKSHDSYFALCPWHDDKNPSLSFTPSKNIFHCFGCGKSSTTIDLVMLKERVDTGQAIKILKERYAHLLHLNGPPPFPLKKESSSASSPGSKQAELLHPNTQKLLKRVVETYHNTLKSSSRPVEYLLKRKIRQGELIDQFKVGYADGTLVGKISDTDTKLLKEIGIINQNDFGNERFKDCIVFPIINELGQITEIYGRSISQVYGKHFYLPGKHQGIFNPKALNHKEIFLCESIIDALSIMSLGYVNVTCSFGINGFTDEMLNLLKEKGVEKVYICYDHDKQAEKAIHGSRAGRGITEKLKNIGIEVYRITFTRRLPETTGESSIEDLIPYKDANDFLCKSPEPAKEFEKLISEAKILYQKETKVDELKESWEYNPSTSSGTSGEYHFSFGNRLYIARGLEKNKTNTSLKLFLKLIIENRFHIDNSLDLFNSKLCLMFCKTAGLSLDLDPKIIKADLDRITQILDEALEKQLAGITEQKKQKFQVDLALSQQARRFLELKTFIVKFIEDIEKCGLVGESLNTFFCFLASLSRHLPDQLHVIIQSESSAGKSTMLNLISSFIPEDDLIYLTQITPKSFYYMKEEELLNKVIAIAELDGMDQAIYPIKQMISEKKLSISYTKTDPQTGEHTSANNKKNVKSAFMLTSPKEGGDEEVDNRSVILTLDESEKQTRRIQSLQRRFRSEEGSKLRAEKERLVRFYQHVQREIKPLEVSNKYSTSLDFKADNHRSRRDNNKYLVMLECLTLLFQNPREQITTNSNNKVTVKTHLIDMALGNFLARRLFRATLDELPPQTRNFFKKIFDHLRIEASRQDSDILNLWITRKQMRELTKLSNNRVHEHASRLLSYEYMLAKREAEGFKYRLSFRPDEDTDSLNSNLNLVSISTLKKKASRQEKEEYDAFIVHLKEIFKALDPSYTEDET